MIFSALTAKIAGIVCAVLAGLLLLSQCEVKRLNASIEKPLTGWRAKLQASEMNLTVCRNSNLSLETGIKAQSDAVDALGAESAARTAEASRRASQARQDASEAVRRADGYLAARSGPDPCVSALALIQGAGR